MYANRVRILKPKYENLNFFNIPTSDNITITRDGKTHQYVFVKRLNSHLLGVRQYYYYYCYDNYNLCRRCRWVMRDGRTERVTV